MAAKKKRGSRVRDHAAEYAAKQRRYRAKGYASEYDYRAHNYGKRAPSAPRLAGEALAKVAGHRGYADLVDNLREGSFVMVDRLGPRDDLGQYRWADVQVIDEYGGSRVFRIRGPRLERDSLDSLVDEIEQAGAVLSPSPSLDIRRLQAPQIKVGRYHAQALGPQLACVVDSHDNDRIVKRMRGRSAFSRAQDLAADLNEQGGE